MVKTIICLNIFKWASTTSISSHGCVPRPPPTIHAASPSCSTEVCFRRYTSVKPGMRQRVFIDMQELF
eukprot:14372804-Heterocapsa_arctica.AAC.1